MITFSEGFSIAMYSSKNSSIFFPLKRVELGAGLLWTNIGGMVSKSPPVGLPMLAQEGKRKGKAKKKRITPPPNHRPIETLHATSLQFIRPVVIFSILVYQNAKIQSLINKIIKTREEMEIFD